MQLQEAAMTTEIGMIGKALQVVQVVQSCSRAVVACRLLVRGSILLIHNRLVRCDVHDWRLNRSRSLLRSELLYSWF